MALKTMTVQLTGIAPLLLHNGQVADPLNPFAKEIKKFTSKRNKTDADYAAIANLEWLAGWYFEDNTVEFAIQGETIVAGDHGAFIIPGYVMDAVLLNGAKKNKLGMLFKSGVFVDGDAPLDIHSTMSLNDLMGDKNYRLSALESVNKSKIVRTRPYIKQWDVTATINYDDSVVNSAQIDQALEMAGKLCGLCERRPKYGRFRHQILNGS